MSRQSHWKNFQQNDHSPEHRDSSYLVRPVGDVSISRLLVRPGSESPLPPIHQDGRRGSRDDRRGSQNSQTTPSRSSPELDSSRGRSPLSVATLTLSDMEPPCYPTRNKTREEFL